MLPAFQALERAINQDAYHWLSQHAPSYVAAIEDAIQSGSTPEQIRRFVQSRTGSERTGLPLRCEQAALYIEAQRAG